MFQETYIENLYPAFHPTGPKADYLYRLETPEKAAQTRIIFFIPDEATISASFFILSSDNATRGILFLRLKPQYIQLFVQKFERYIGSL